AAALGEMKSSDNERIGVQIVRRAMEEPARRIANNAGADGSVVLDKIRNGKGAFGYNAASEAFGDLLKEGIIHPTNVVRTALQTAAWVAGLCPPTGAISREKPKDKKAAAPAAPSYDDM